MEKVLIELDTRVQDLETTVEGLEDYTSSVPLPLLQPLADTATLAELVEAHNESVSTINNLIKRTFKVNKVE